MAIVLNGTTGITAPDIDVTAQATDITTTGDITAVDATLSGGVYLGGTGSANYLDDYEEGTFTPTFNNVTLGNGTVSGAYVKIGDIVHLNIRLVWGSTTSFTGNVTLYIPFTTAAYHQPLLVSTLNSGLYWNTALFRLNPSNTLGSFEYAANNAYASNNLNFNATSPFTWATNDEIQVNGTIRIA